MRNTENEKKISLENLLIAMDKGDNSEIFKEIKELENNFANNFYKPIMQYLRKNKESKFIQENLFEFVEKVSGKYAMAHLVNLLKENDVDLRNKTLDVILNIEQYGVNNLIKLITDADKNIRKIALDGLYRSSIKNALPAIKNCLNDEDINIRIAAVEYIGKNKDFSAKNEILNLLLNETNIMLKSACIEALSEIGDLEVLQKIELLIKKGGLSKNLLLFSYLKMLGKIGDMNAFEFISENADYFFSNNITELADSLVMIMERNKIIEIPEAFVKAVMEIFKNILNDSEKVKLLFFISKYNLDELRPVILENFKNENDYIKSAIIECFNIYGFENDIQELQRIMRDEPISEEIKELIEDILTLKTAMEF